MRRGKLTILIIMLMSVLALAGDRVAPNLADSFRAANLMPKGALLYIQSRDMSGQLRRWYKSGTHKRYFESANYKAFMQSRLALKFSERVGEFEGATGLSLSEDGLATSVGGQSALAFYDIGNLEFIFTTELPQAQLAAAAIMQQAAKLETRKYGNTSYYIKSTSSELGGEARVFTCAIIGNRIVVATKEDLIQQVIKNNSDAKSTDRLSESIVATANKADGFIATDITLWLDQTELNKDLYFKNYWIHSNVKELAKLSNVLIDLELNADGIKEKRWLFQTDANGQAENGDLTNILKYAPVDAELVNAEQVTSDHKRLMQNVENILFGREYTAQTPQNVNTNGTLPALTDSTNNGEQSQPQQQYQRYISLDERFDQDIDDAQLSAVTEQKSQQFVESMDKLITTAQPIRFAQVGEPVLDTTSGFVKFNRAIIIELAQPAQLSPAQFETIITTELSRRFVVAGSNIKFQYQGDANSGRSLDRALIEHGGAYLVQNNFLIIANSKEYLAKLLAAPAANNAPKATVVVPLAPVQFNTKLTRYAAVRLTGGQAPFDKLMRRLDGVGQVVTTPTQPINGAEGDEIEAVENSEVRLFSQNFSSLIDVAKDITTVTFEQTANKGVIKEQLNYNY